MTAPLADPGIDTRDERDNSNSEWAIQAYQLCKNYDGKAAVIDVDLQVGLGEIFALLGPNGAGKTTIIEILAGFRHRDSGDASVLGRDPQQSTPAWRAQLGIVSQTSNDFDELRVAEVVTHFAAYYPAAHDPDAVLNLVGLADNDRQQVKTLSGGQRRRLDVALGVIGRPRVLFLDEPTVGFDPKARRDFWKVIRALAKSGTTILLTTHYLEEAENLADRVAVLLKGHIIEVATPQTLGGRATTTTTVRWAGPTGYESIQTDSPTAFIAELSQRFAGEIPELTVTRPSLEQIYLTMIEANQ